MKATMIKQLAHICLGAKDLADAERFYCGLLGLKKKFSFMKKDKTAGLYLTAGNGVFIEIFPVGDESTADKMHLLRHLCLEVEKLDVTIATLRKAGWEITDKKLGCDGSWQAWTHDPSGIPIEFHEYTATSNQLTGEDCHVDW
jgi:catechol 2,3-dioxygenase-like lactoylglutathione lyase family enzyme